MPRICVALYDFQNTFSVHIVSFNPRDSPMGKGIILILSFQERKTKAQLVLRESKLCNAASLKYAKTALTQVLN